MIKTLSAIALACGVLAGCANPPPISTNPLQTAVSTVESAVGSDGVDVITQGILNAQYNFNQAVSLGILSSTDPAPGCLNSVAAVMGIGGTAPPSFVPKVTDLISAGSVGYIYLQQLKAATGGTLQVSPACEQLVGQIIIDATKLGAKAAVGSITGGIIPNLPLGATAPAGGGSPHSSLQTPAYAALSDEANPSLGGK